MFEAIINEQIALADLYQPLMGDEVMPELLAKLATGIVRALIRPV